MSRKPLVKRTQNKQEKEDPKKERNHLRQENRQLKRQIARLSKAVKLLEGIQEDEIDILVESTISDAPADERVAEGCCPLCGADALGTYTLPSGTIRIGCKACKKYRGKETNT